MTDITISDLEYQELHEAQVLLDRLYETGVSDWTGFAFAYSEANRLLAYERIQRKRLHALNNETLVTLLLDVHESDPGATLDYGFHADSSDILDAYYYQRRQIMGDA